MSDYGACLVLHVTTFRRRLTPEMHSPNTAHIGHGECISGVRRRRNVVTCKTRQAPPTISQIRTPIDI